MDTKQDDRPIRKKLFERGELDNARTGIYKHPTAPDREFVCHTRERARAFTKWGYTKERNIKDSDLSQKNQSEKEFKALQAEVRYSEHMARINDRRADLIKQNARAVDIDNDKELKALNKEGAHLYHEVKKHGGRVDVA